VNVSAWPNVVEVGDTLSAFADGFNANGNLTAWAAPRVWRVSDSSIITLRGPATQNARVLLGALRPGTVRVFARIGNHEGSDSLRVIARLAPITFTPSAVSMRFGDSVRVVADIRATTGDPVTGVGVFWRASDIGVVSTGCCTAITWLRSSALYGKPGTTTVTATVAHAAGILTVTVTP
jgi:hypothetical protein